MRAKTRCAIYTRKSSEEGLEQAFNSLHAQREACEAFIQSQRHEGWTLLPEAYDDGGFSGGSMERPALRRLLADIAANRIHVVVVYKVDRLTRSLADFAKIVEVLDAKGASFVSVTQQFNTTSSMGRLTLNVLLSFAQFEREVTGERIRDKIAASKKKGMWMGGNVPLGYDVVERKLVVNEVEAETVRMLFRLYLELGSVRKVREGTQRLGLRPKAKRRPAGESQTAASFGRGQLYYLLSNPLYIGMIRHLSLTYPGMHEAIVDRPLWDGVQARLANNKTARRSRTDAREPSLLAGLLFDSEGNRFTPSHAVKAGKRYRYYVERSLITGTRKQGTAWRRLPAGEIEAVVLEALKSLLHDPEELLGAVKLESGNPAVMDLALRSAKVLGSELSNAHPGRQREIVRGIVHKVVLGEQCLSLEIGVGELSTMLSLDGAVHGDDIHSLTRPLKRRLHRGVTKLVIVGSTTSEATGPDPALVKAVVRAHRWWEQLMSGAAAGTGDIAKAEGVARSYVSRVLRLAFLDPEITRRILHGRQPADLTAWRLIDDRTLPLL